MRKLIFFAFFLIAHCASAQWFYYQPTPYPLKKADGSAMLQDINIVHAWEGWLPSVYYGQTLQRDDKLQIGGWGDRYLSYLKFDLAGLPTHVNSAYLYLMPKSRNDSSTTVPYAACIVTSSWDLSMTLNSKPGSGTCYGWYGAPTLGQWSGIWLTRSGGVNWYNDWKSGALANNGIMLYPQGTNNQFDVFYATKFADYATDPYADAKRPVLALEFTPTLELKMPLPNDASWLLTTEAGGYDCLAGNRSFWPDTAHTDNNSVNGIIGSFFSLDFDNETKEVGVRNNVPILAAARGRVVQVVYGDQYNGNYVVIAHVDANGNPNGFTTRYLHLVRNTITAYVGNAIIPQGKVLGYMGDTGVHSGINLHFGVVYNNQSRSTTPELTRVVMEGKLLKSYQTECAVDSVGRPVHWSRYYNSSNVPIY